MSDGPNITREEMERWPEETRVACDLLLGHGFAVAADFPSVEVPQADVRPYGMRDLDGRPSLFGLRPFTREMYEAWAGNSASTEPFGPQHIERWERMERSRRYSDCPLCGCEDFEGQMLVPVACPGKIYVSNEILRDEPTYGVIEHRRTARQHLERARPRRRLDGRR